MGRTRSWMAFVVLGAGLVGAMAGAASGRPIEPAERRYSPYTGLIPACDDPRVLDRISFPFREKEAEYWHSALAIVGFDHIVQYGFRNEGRDHIPRRFCHAQATLNDRHRHEVVYSVGENVDYAGYDYGVDWCVVGLDRNLAYGPDCRAARP